MYQEVYTLKFQKILKKLSKKNPQLTQQVYDTIQTLKKDPYYPSLKTHQVQSALYGICKASWVTGNIRILWNFDEYQKLTILILTLGSHSGKGKVYN